MSEQDETLGRHVGAALRRGAVLIVLAAVVGGLLAAAVSLVRPTTWSANAYVLLNSDPTNPTAGVEDRTTAAEAAFATSDRLLTEVSDATGPGTTYSVNAVPGTDGLTFVSVATSRDAAVETARTAAETYVEERQEGLESRLRGQVTAAQADADAIAAQIESLPQTEAASSQRAAVASQLSAAYLLVQEKQAQLDAIPQSASILNVDPSASKNGPRLLFVLALGAVLGAILMAAALVGRDRTAPKVGTNVPAGEGEDVFTGGRTAGGARGADVVVDVGAAAVTSTTIEDGGVVGVFGTADPALLRAVAGELARARFEGAPDLTVVDGVDEVPVSELAREVAAGRQREAAMVLVGRGTVAAELYSQVARPGDVALVVVEPHTTSQAEVRACIAPLRRSGGRVAWLVLTPR